MSTDANLTLTFALPLPQAAHAYLKALILDNHFSQDWDEKPVDLDALEIGSHRLFSRSFVSGESVISKAKELGFSFTLQVESFSFDSPGNHISFYDATEKRSGLFMDCAEDGAPYVTLAEVLSSAKEVLIQKYRLPSMGE